MERYDSTMRAARYVISVGTFAAAMLAMTAASASAQTSNCPDGGEGTPTFCGHVFTDTIGGVNDDGNFDVGEGITEPVYVAITNASGTNVANSPTLTGDCFEPENCGYFAFRVFDAENYWICIVADGESDDCRDLDVHPESVLVTAGSTPVFVDFEIGEEGPDPNDIWGVGTGTPGYWKNHPEAWPAAGITIGGVNYSTLDAIAKMGKVSGDKTYSMFAALVSAKLNTMLANNATCISATITSADQWMADHPVGSNVKASSAYWAAAQEWHQRLDDYNNGKLCAPHRG